MTEKRRRLPRKGLSDLRLRTVHDIEDGLVTVDEAVRVNHVARSTVFGWLAMYREGGDDALLGTVATGRPAKFPSKYIDRLYGLIVGRDPRRYQFEFALWSREMVRQLIRGEVWCRALRCECRAPGGGRWSQLFSWGECWW